MASFVAVRQARLVLALVLLSSACGNRSRDDPPRPTVTDPTASAAPVPSAAKSAVNPRITRAEAYVFNEGGSPMCPLVLGADGALCPSARPAKKQLSREQIERAITIFTEPEFSPLTAPWCFEPHHGIVFYDAANAPVSAISVCFECERQAGWPQSVVNLLPEKMPHMSPAARAAWQELLCGELGLPRCGRR